ncbi:cupin domain-containing protein [Ruminococcaceae bacterium OttesenSCG-928-O06]|nr:cupin domain-containing protein [Ruminococcaceae bacterium OttesenSCG-928-O06]
MEKVYGFNQSNEKLIEKILDDDVVMINHIILNQGEALPQHDSNSNVYLIVVRGVLTAQLGDNAPKSYENGNIINVPGKIRMNISNAEPDQLEFFVVKAPSPRLYI